MGTYYKKCEHCGANLDPGERCEDCKENKEKAMPASTTDPRVSVKPNHST